MKMITKQSLIVSVAITIISMSSVNAGNNFHYRGYKKAPKSPALGITAGLNFSNINGEYDEFTKNNLLPSYNFGATCRIKVSKTFFVEPQLLYSVKGTNIKTSYTETYEEPGLKSTIDIKEDYKQTLSYIDVPVLAKYQAKSGFNVFGGPTASFLLSAKAAGSYNAVTTTTYDIPGIFEGTETEETSEAINKTSKEGFSNIDFGVAAGVGYQMKNGVGASLKYNRGLSSIQTEGDKYTNSVISLNMNYVFK